MLVCGCADESDGLLAGMVLLLFETDVRGINESQKYLILLYMDVVSPIDTVDGTNGSVRMRRSTDDGVDYSLR